MQFKTSDDTLLHIEKKGNGPVLILVPGANGTGIIFSGIVELLKDRFTVITFDRRGYGETELSHPLPDEAASFDNRYRLLTDANDVLELADAFSPDQPVNLFGTSSGSIVAAQAFSLKPDRFVKVAIHESPIMTVTEEYRESYKKQVSLVDEALKKDDFSVIKDLFANMHIAPLDAQMMGMNPNKTVNPEKMKPKMYWLKYEILQYTGQTINWSIFLNNREKIILFNGTDSTGFLPQEITKEIGKKIGVPITMIPGAHLGYEQNPIEFAETLKATLDD